MRLALLYTSLSIIGEYLSFTTHQTGSRTQYYTQAVKMVTRFVWRVLARSGLRSIVTASASRYHRRYLGQSHGHPDWLSFVYWQGAMDGHIILSQYELVCRNDARIAHNAKPFVIDSARRMFKKCDILLNMRIISG